MATLTPKISLKKPVVNEETNWGSRLNESLEILDDTMLTANVTGTGLVTITDDGSGNVTISGSTADPLTTGALTTSGQVTFNLPADEAFLIDGATNQREITIGAFRQLHTPAIPGTRALNYVIDMNSQPDTSAIVAEYKATGLTNGSQGTIFKVTIDTADSTAGVVESYHVTAVGSGSAEVHALHAGPGVCPIEHESGVFGNINTAFTFDDSLSAFADVTSDFNSTSSNVTLFVEDDDLVYIGEDATFDAVSVLLDTAATNPGVKPEFEFWNGSIWNGFGPVDGTNGFRVNGSITWEVVDLSGWETVSVNGATKFWIRIRRTANNVSTLPVELLVQSVSSVRYDWDCGGNVTVASLTAATGTFTLGITSPQINSDTVFTEDLTVSGTAINFPNLPTASGSLNSGDLWVDVGDNYALRITP